MTATDAPAKSRRPRARRPGASSRLRDHVSGRVDAFNSAILAFPLFVVYQVGILASHGQNGVDILTRSLVDLCQRDLANYLAILAAMTATYLAVVVLLRRRGEFNPGAFVFVLAESSLYATTMGAAIIFVMSEYIGVVPGLFITTEANPLNVVVIAAGAGLHEELIFRVIGMGGLAWLLSGVTGSARAWFIALVFSSLAFSLAHHVLPGTEAFTFSAFTFRFLAGVVFAVIYQTRGAAVAMWTHALYDVYVLMLR